MRSASVDFPWSMWAMMEKLRMFFVGVDMDLQRRANARWWIWGLAVNGRGA
jgi:hypothetical protein